MSCLYIMEYATNEVVGPFESSEAARRFAGQRFDDWAFLSHEEAMGDRRSLIEGNQPYRNYVPNLGTLTRKGA